MKKLFALFCFSAALAIAGPLTVAVDTSAWAGQDGYLDIQFNPGIGAARPATATISGFTLIGGGALGAAADSGTITGTLPGVVSITNDAGINGPLQAITFGSGFIFLLDMSSTPVAGASAESLFSVSLLDSALSAYLGPVPVAGVTVGVDGALSLQSSDIGVVAPEPASALLLLGGIAALAVFRRR
jgi:hypothetical protein